MVVLDVKPRLGCTQKPASANAQAQTAAFRGPFAPGKAPRNSAGAAPSYRRAPRSRQSLPMTAFPSLAARARRLLFAATASLALALPAWAASPSLSELVGGASPASGAPAGVFQSPQTRAELVVHAPQGLGGGQPAWLVLLLVHAPQWHSYW